MNLENFRNGGAPRDRKLLQSEFALALGFAYMKTLTRNFETLSYVPKYLRPTGNALWNRRLF